MLCIFIYFLGRIACKLFVCLFVCAAYCSG